MYKQEKYYLVLVKENNLWDEADSQINTQVNSLAGEFGAKKLAEAGLQKITLTEQKIRVDFYLNNLPVFYGISMECRLKYRQQGETTTTRSWREKLVKDNSHYTFQMTLNKPVETILDCRLHLQGGYLVVAKERLLTDRKQPGDEEKGEYSEQSGDGGRNETGNKILTVGEIRAAEEAVKAAVQKNENVTDEASDKVSESDKGKIDRPNFREIEYIRDLEYLKNKEGELSELYYNSFLLHGFYQHHYFILGKDFIGVPDHFYEREAIAAKMMGFPYFIEGDNVENCNISGEVRKELPEVGSFGYFLRKLS